MTRLRAWATPFAACLALVLALAPVGAAGARDLRGPGATVSAATLPKEAREVLQLVAQGGPFRYARDGVVFGNREKQLPAKPRGYYHEYTVHTPGSHNRGARRIVCGGDRKVPDACWYTDDHYATFRRIEP